MTTSTNAVDTVVERLRASKAEHEASMKDAGNHAGREWATHHAEYADLKRLYENDTADIGPVDPQFSNAGTCAHQLLSIIDPVALENGDLPQFMECAGIDEADEDDPDFIHAFIQSALDVWSTVKDQV